jgi:hypothetical protein
MRYEILENDISSEVVEGKQALYARWEELVLWYKKKGSFDWCAGFLMMLRDKTVIKVLGNNGKEPRYNRSEWKDK